MSETKKFNKSEQMQLLGLQAVYQKHWSICEAVFLSAKEITGEDPDDCGRAEDFICGGESVKKLEELLAYDFNKKQGEKNDE